MASSVSAGVDVVVVSWNVREELAECLAALAASEVAPAGVVVVDNASSDGSVEMVAARFPDARVIPLRENHGFAVAANRGVHSGSAEYVLFLNPDAAVTPGAIGTMRERLAALPSHAAVAPRLLGADGTPQHSVHRFPSLGISLLLALGLQHLLPRRWGAALLLEGAWDSAVERDVPWAIGAALLTRRATLAGIGGFDERLFLYAEDLEWCDRAARAGLRVRFVPSAEVVHHGDRSGAQLHRGDRVAAYMQSTLAFLRRRHGGAWTSAFVAINGGGTVARYGFYRAAGAALGGRPWVQRGLAAWRPYARFYLRRNRGVRRPGYAGNNA